MSYRTRFLKQIGIDSDLGNDVALSWELDLGLSVKRLGQKIAYDPDLKVFHYSGPREQAGMRRGAAPHFTGASHINCPKKTRRNV
jgi:hypothetical protein